MPIQVYDCPKDGEFDYWQNIREEVLKQRPCPTCSAKSPHKLKPCGGIVIARGWNEQANDYQRDPYTMAKAQAINNYNEQRDMGNYIPAPLEADIQVAAAAIAVDKGPTEYVHPIIKNKKRKKQANG